MADKLQRELSNRHIQLIAIGGARNISFWPIYSFSRPIYLTNIHNSSLFSFVFMSYGRITVINLGFKSFGDIAHHHIGSMAGFMVGWTYWLTWIISGMAEVTAVAVCFLLVSNNSKLVNSCNDYFSFSCFKSIQC